VFDVLAQAESKRKIQELSKRMPCGSGQATAPACNRRSGLPPDHAILDLTGFFRRTGFHPGSSPGQAFARRRSGQKRAEAVPLR